jgi:ABC-type amino acid transport substrate-binding protein
MRCRRKSLSIGSSLLLCLSLFLAACGALSLGGGDPATLRVGSSGTYPPFTFADAGILKGVEIDFARSLANEIGRPVEIVQVPFPDLIGELNAGRIDVVMSGMSMTPRRQELVSFTNHYLAVGQMALVRKEDDARFAGKDWTRIEGLSVGFERATTGAKYVLGTLKNIKPVEFASKEDGLRALKEDKIDVFVHDAPFVWLVAGSPHAPNEEVVGRFTPLTDEKLAWAVRKGDDDLLEDLNAVVARWHDSGEIDAVLDRWIKVRKVTRPVP